MTNETAQPETNAQPQQVAPNNELLPCPFCGGKAVWCGGQDETDLHDCHFIVCGGECGTQFDTVANDNAAETLKEMRAIAAKKFNQRAT